MNMECGSLVGLLIEKDVDPQIITKLLVPIAQTRGVPVISLSGLRSAAYKACGIKCIALGFKVRFRNVYNLQNFISKHY